MKNEITPQVARAIKEAGPDDIMDITQDVVNTMNLVDSVNEEMAMLMDSVDYLNNSLDVYEQRRRVCREKLHKTAMRLA